MDEIVFMAAETNPRRNWQVLSSMVCDVTTQHRDAVIACPNPKACSFVFSPDGGKVFFRGYPARRRPATLLYAEINTSHSSSRAAEGPSRVDDVVSRDGVDVTYCSSQHAAVDSLPRVEWHSVFSDLLPREPLTREEKLLHERQRTAFSSVSYEYNPASDSFLLSCSGRVYEARTTAASTDSPSQVCACRYVVGKSVPPPPPPPLQSRYVSVTVFGFVAAKSELLTSVHVLSIV